MQTDSSETPLLENGAADGPIVCQRCGATAEPPSGRCGVCGRFLPGNQAAVTTGLFRRQQAAELRAEAEALVAGVVADKGGEGELSTLQRAYVSHLADVVVMLRLLAADAAARGLLTPGGNPRRTVDTYLAVLDRFDRLAQRIGLRREARKLRSNLEAFIDGR